MFSEHINNQFSVKYYSMIQVCDVINLKLGLSAIFLCRGKFIIWVPNTLTDFGNRKLH